MKEQKIFSIDEYDAMREALAKLPNHKNFYEQFLFESESTDTEVDDYSTRSIIGTFRSSNRAYDGLFHQVRFSNLNGCSQSDSVSRCTSLYVKHVGALQQRAAEMDEGPLWDSEYISDKSNELIRAKKLLTVAAFFVQQSASTDHIKLRLLYPTVIHERIPMEVRHTTTSLMSMLWVTGVEEASDAVDQLADAQNVDSRYVYNILQQQGQREELSRLASSLLLPQAYQLQDEVLARIR